VAQEINDVDDEDGEKGQWKGNFCAEVYSAGGQLVALRFPIDFDNWLNFCGFSTFLADFFNQTSSLSIRRVCFVAGGAP
jgi:hypothetical protein